MIQSGVKVNWQDYDDVLNEIAHSTCASGVVITEECEDGITWVVSMTRGVSCYVRLDMIRHADMQCVYNLRDRSVCTTGKGLEEFRMWEGPN